MKQMDVVGICNALVDILIEVKESDLVDLSLRKAAMHLVDSDAQGRVLEHFKSVDHTVELGGSAMNAIRTLAELGKKTTFAGMVSADEYGRRIQARMKELNIKAHLGSSNEPTGTCVVLITPDGERTLHTHLGASRLYTVAEVPHEDIKSAKVLHFCGYQWDTEGQMGAIREAIDTAKNNNTLVSFDVADPFVVERHHASFMSLIETDADIVFANKEESQMLFNLTPEETAARIAKSGATAVIKLGGEGAWIQKGDTTAKIEPVKTKVVDTTAAGDMFAAGFLYGVTSDRDIETSGRMAAILAADVISRIGATVSNNALATVGSM